MRLVGLLLVVVLSLAQNSLGGSIQLSNLRLPPDAKRHASAIQDIFVDTYSAYRKYAYPHDDLAPVTKNYTGI